MRGRLVKAALSPSLWSACSATAFLGRALFDYLAAAPARSHLVFTHPVGRHDGLPEEVSFLCGALFSTLRSRSTRSWPSSGRPLGLALAWRKALGWSPGGSATSCSPWAWPFALKVLPMAMHFLLAFDRPGLRAMLNVDQYFSFVFLITFRPGRQFSDALGRLLHRPGRTGRARPHRGWHCSAWR